MSMNCRDSLDDLLGFFILIFPLITLFNIDKGESVNNIQAGQGFLKGREVVGYLCLDYGVSRYLFPIHLSPDSHQVELILQFCECHLS